MGSSYSPIKKPGTVINYTKEMMKEVLRCQTDPIYFFKNFAYIQSEGGKMLFDAYPYQEEMVESFTNNKNSVLLTARQMGKCLCGETLINIRNKVTGEMLEITMEEFHQMQRKE